MAGGRVQKLYEHQSALSALCATMYRNGIFVDERARRALATKLQREEDEARRAFKKLAPDFEPSPNEMRALLYRRHSDERRGFNLPDPLNPKMWKSEEKISVAEAPLRLLIIDPDTPPEAVQIVEAYWKVIAPRKARSTFVDSNLVLQAIGRDGRLRPGWNSCGTDTGRFSCSKPNVMNVEKSLRSMYAAPKGHILIHADFSQLELRIMYAVSGDEALGDALRSGDVYTYEAKKSFALPDHLVKCECDGDCKEPDNHLKSSARKSQKIVSLASQYAASTPQVYSQYLAEDRTVTWQRVKQQHEAWKRVRRGTVEYWSREWDRVMATGYSESRIMRRRVTYAAPPTLNRVVNYPIQSTAADVANLAGIDLDNALHKYAKRAKLNAQQHDAFTIECPEDDALGVAAIVEECMAQEREIEGVMHKFPVDVRFVTSLDKA